MSVTTTTFTDSSGQVHGMYVPDNNFTGYTANSLNNVFDSVTSAPNTYITTTDSAWPTDILDRSGHVNITYDWLQEAYNRQYANQQVSESKHKDKITLVDIIRNRSNAFRDFIHSLLGRKMKEGDTVIPESEMNLDSKKRARHWASKLFEPITVSIEQFMYVKELGNGENSYHWIDAGGENFTVIPVGMDLWGTVNALSPSASDAVDWSKAHLSFIPSKSLLSKIKDAKPVICFTVADKFSIIIEKQANKESVRHIDL